MYLASGVWSHAVLSGIGDDVRTDLNKTIPSYDRVLAYQRVWDTLHQRVSEGGDERGSRVGADPPRRRHPL